MVKISLPSGDTKEYSNKISVLEVAKSISPTLAKKAVFATVDQVDRPLNFVIEQDSNLILHTKEEQVSLNSLRATTAFFLGKAIKTFNSEAVLGDNNFSEDGFYYDSDIATGQISVDQLGEITDLMGKELSTKAELTSVYMSVTEAIDHFKDNEYKVGILKELKNDHVYLNSWNGFDDFSLVPLDVNYEQIKHFKLLYVAGAYFLGKSSNKMFQRVAGTAFFNQNDLDEDEKRREIARSHDHRVLGQQLDLFFVDPKIGAGLPYWLPKGATIRRIIERYIIDKEVADGYEHVYTPVLANLDLYKTSGHWDHYREDMFPPMDMGDGELLELRPMNCPSHIEIYKHKPRSYRDLPLRIAELGMMHRYEKSGALSGLQRVREMTLNDGHTFVSLDQIQDEFKKVLKLMMEVYHDFDIKDYKFRLSYRDKANTEKYFDDDEMWNRSQAMLKGAMDDLGLDYYEAEGEAAFYGPKLDVQTKTALGNEETMSTIQLDFMQPERFELTYVGADGEDHRPIMIHRGIVGTMERFVSYLTEIYMGAFPTWLSPVQIDIIPVNNDLHRAYAEKLAEDFRKSGLRVQTDLRKEKMNYKIRESQTQKIPYTLIVGDKESESGNVTVRRYGQEAQDTMTEAEFIQMIRSDIANYSRES
ncbi:threonine--tRNA ligase [Xylocopilactobacillus apicola]|uniref:Threonine--tRNA ligase n=1 Tax=Xylocopilactobacillus apicola TaxID=2932184 RepID=A0AAU9CX10_9LACO|nr:threonine--tRNA ligase [Xylocopilactobacillus apicola]BDR58522.1 threonine--tRNA ligase [Xylocopilactobacillus apicola]